MKRIFFIMFRNVVFFSFLLRLWLILQFLYAYISIIFFICEFIIQIQLTIRLPLFLFYLYTY